MTDNLIASAVSALVTLYKQQAFYIGVSVQAIGLICKYYDISSLPQIKLQNVCRNFVDFLDYTIDFISLSLF